MKISVEDFLKNGAIFSDSSDSFWVAWGQPIRLREAPRDFSMPLFYAPDFFLTEDRPWWQFQACLRVGRAELIQSLRSFLQAGGGRFSWKSQEPISASSFFDQFQKIQSVISCGILQKAVPVIFDRMGDVGDRSQWLCQALVSLLQSTQGWALALYGLWEEDSAEGVLGATPELLFWQDQKEGLWTMALAGTRLKSEGRDQKSLLEDPKERREHQWVIDGIQEAFTPLGRVHVHPTEEVEFPSVFHLKTLLSVCFSVQGSDGCDPFSAAERFLQAVQALHPTPALGTFPRNRWREFSSLLGGASRGRFGAPFGILSSDRSVPNRCAVAIRNIQWNSQGVWMAAGCGVIQESQPDREWAELQGKLRSVRRLFGWEEVL